MVLVTTVNWGATSRCKTRKNSLPSTEFGVG
jgi:hypothetical protein